MTTEYIIEGVVELDPERFIEKGFGEWSHTMKSIKKILYISEVEFLSGDILYVVDEGVYSKYLFI